MGKASKKLIKAAKRARKIARWLAKAERSLRPTRMRQLMIFSLQLQGHRGP
jgi:hypothetical protein